MNLIFFAIDFDIYYIVCICGLNLFCWLIGFLRRSILNVKIINYIVFNRVKKWLII